MKIALVHDHLMQDGGAERVLQVFHELFPSAPIHTLVYDRKLFSKIFPPENIRTSWLQRLPFAKNFYQWLLPLMPLATEMYDLTGYDVVLSNSSAFSKGVITKPGTIHICYCHTPTRYLWTDSLSYVRDLRKGAWARPFLPFLFKRLRMWDRLAADRVDHFIANSATVQGRIQKFYGRNSELMFPPVEVEKFSISENPKEYYLAGGRIVSYKRFDIIVDAFNRLGFPIKIFGVGPELDVLRKKAKQNIQFLGAVSDQERICLFQDCKAFIHPQEEDFGITPVEAMAAGRPVIAYAAGGALETIREEETGLFFINQDYAALIAVLLKFDTAAFTPECIREHALQFSTKRFKIELLQFMKRVCDKNKNYVIQSAAKDPVVVCTPPR